MATEKSRVRALKQRIDDLPSGAKRNHMQRSYACLESMQRRLQNIHDGTGSVEDMEALKRSVRSDAESIAYLMFNIYADLNGSPAMWMAAGGSK